MSGLALLVGGTALTAMAGNAHSIFATILLGLLTVGMGHAFVDEIGRQARRGSPSWAGHDTVNTVLLATWSVGALIAAVLVLHPTAIRAVGLALSLGYALSCAHFVVERRRTIARLDTERAHPPGTMPHVPEPAQPPTDAPPNPEQTQPLPAAPPNRAA